MKPKIKTRSCSILSLITVQFVFFLLLFTNNVLSQTTALCEEEEPDRELFEVEADDHPLCLVYHQDGQFDITAGTKSDLISQNGNSAYFAYKRIKITGDINFDQNVTFLGCFIEVAPGKKIEVTGAQTTLNITSTKIWACDEMWLGIRIKPSNIIIFYNSEIEDAYYAINLESGTTASIYSSNISRNNYGVTNAAPGSTKGKIRFNKFYSNTFRCHYPMNYPYSSSDVSYAGIDIENNPYGIPLGKLGESPNSFNNLYVGIRAVSTNLDIKNTKFKNIRVKPGQPHSGEAVYAEKLNLNFLGLGKNSSDKTFEHIEKYGIYANSSSVKVTESYFDDFGYIAMLFFQIGNRKIIFNNNKIISGPIGPASYRHAIYGERAGASCEIKSNQINLSESDQYGITIFSSNMDYNNDKCPLEVANNNIKVADGIAIGIGIGGNINIHDNTIECTDPASDRGGIFVDLGNNTSTTKSIVENNVIGKSSLTTTTSPGLENDFGILIRSLNKCNVGCNSVNNFDKGIAFNNMCHNSFIYVNDIKKNHYGLYMNAEAELNEPQTLKGNTWSSNTNDYSNYAAIHLGSPFFAIFFVNNTSPPFLKTYSPFPVYPFGWFKPISGTNLTSCASGPGSCIGCGNFTIYDTMIVNLQYDTLVTNSMRSWEARKALFYKVKELAAVNTYMSSFVTGLLSNNIYKFWKVDSIVNKANDIGNTNFVLIDTLYDRMLAKWNITQNDTTFSALTDTAILAFNNYHLFLDSMENIIKSGLILARSYNSTISTSNKFEQYLKTINEVKLFKSIFPDSISVLNDSLINLIAEDCVFNGGFSVLTARMLNFKCDEPSFSHYSDICPRSNDILKSVTPINTNYNIFPNPTQNICVIRSENGFSGENIILINSIGKKIPHSFDIINEAHEVTLNTTEIPNGLYFVTIRKSNKYINTFKLIIQH